MKFFKYIALAVLASTISASAVSTETVGNLKRTDTVVTAVDDLISDTELETALNSYATKAWAATTATNAANHAAGSKVSKVTTATENHVVVFANGGEVKDTDLAVDDLLTSASLDSYAKKSDFSVTTNTANKTITINLAGKSATALYDHQNISALTAHVADTDIHVTSADKTAWNAKYDKPSGGIATNDLAQAVITSLGKADNAVQKQTLTALGANDTIDTLYKRVNQIIQVLKNETFTP